MALVVDEARVAFEAVDAEVLVAGDFDFSLTVVLDEPAEAGGLAEEEEETLDEARGFDESTSRSSNPKAEMFG